MKYLVNLLFSWGSVRIIHIGIRTELYCPMILRILRGKFTVCMESFVDLSHSLQMVGMFTLVPVNSLLDNTILVDLLLPIEIRFLYI